MSRLYSIVKSDARKNPATARGHRHIIAQLLYGNTARSVEAVDIRLEYDDVHDEYSVTCHVRGYEKRTYILPKP
jgi:hypothetical protein